jgi:ABC-type polysaccharide/polyol phosphate export permease
MPHENKSSISLFMILTMVFALLGGTTYDCKWYGVTFALAFLSCVCLGCAFVSYIGRGPSYRRY